VNDTISDCKRTNTHPACRSEIARPREFIYPHGWAHALVASRLGLEAGVLRSVLAIILRRRAVPLGLPGDRHGGELVEAVGGAGLLAVFGSATLMPVIFSAATNSLSNGRLMFRSGKVYI
jgi:hypothetical protein